MYLDIRAYDDKTPDGRRATFGDWHKARGRLSHFLLKYPTVLVWRVADDGARTLVLRYDTDGYDL